MLGKYAREEKLLSLQEAIRKMTSLPAANLKLEKRGKLDSGYYADVVVFDADSIADLATYDDPHQYSLGMIHVFVNGVQVLDHGHHTHANREEYYVVRDGLRNDPSHDVKNASPYYIGVSKQPYPIVQSMMFLRKKLIPVIVTILMLIISCAEAQSLKDHLKKGDRYYQRKDYENALKKYLEAVSLDNNHPQANFKVGMSFLNEESSSKAVVYLEKAYELRPDVHPNIDYHLAMAYQEDHQFTKAREHFEAFKAKYENLEAVADQKIMECILGDSLMKIPVHGTVRPLEQINTAFAEFSPLLTADRKTLIFTSNRSIDDYEIKSATNFGDVYVSKNAAGQWGVAEKISPQINVELNEAAISLSFDGKTLFLYYEEGRGNIYSSQMENGKWSAPVALNRFVNHPHYRESGACVSPDGKKIYFSSNRPGGKGGYDIYVCKMGTNGDWGRPSNLGSTINSRKDEEFPFVDADGKTLYFSSNGHPTLGEHDIFKTTWQGDRWTTPANLGYPINTSGYEGNFILTTDQKTGYFSSRRVESAGNMDMYSVAFSAAPAVTASSDIPQQTESKPGGKNIVTVLNGTVIDAASTTPLQASIRLVDNFNKIVLSAVKTGPSGNFELVIPYEGNFGVTTEKAGYLFNSMNFNIPPFETYQEINTHILMVKAEVGSKVVLKNVFFDVNESALKPESLSELQNIRDLLLQNPEWRVQINGHTDNVGHPKANMALSLKRAESVVQYLVKQGISPGRLQAKGFGSERPLVSNDDESEGRQINRRTEIEIIE